MFALTALIVSAVAMPAQRCGDHIWVYLTDDAGKPIPPSKYKAVKITVTTIDYEHDRRLVVRQCEPDLLEVPKGITSFSVRTGCGLEEIKYEFEYREKKMVIVPNDPPIAGG